ncbi:Fructosamine kinase-domain-containing protein [Tribonema minus]|uniref:protein-ribulosamine 3-kinase n=1 Tax=Tribonema minus TaxID=303371 RepID=A0A835YJQ4_9STRA|nr:Fructosamine kinase-domain-containing protein [Tribonema minus]
MAKPTFASRRCSRCYCAALLWVGGAWALVPPLHHNVKAGVVQQRCTSTRNRRASLSASAYAHEAAPDGLRDVVIEALVQHGAGGVTSVKDVSPGPGLHTRHFKYDTADGPFLCKVSERSSDDHFKAEMASLQAIRSMNCLRAPEPLSCGALPLGGSYLLMEYLPCIPFGQSIPSVLQQLAEGLAQMHLTPPPALSGLYGFSVDGLLGGANQDNAWDDDFATFFLEQRLIPQYHRAAAKFSANYGTSNQESSALMTLEEQVFEAARQALLPVKNVQPSLLHGDLWIGNCGAILGGTDGTTRVPVVFDPACWYGHHEFDLALGSLFGGFPPPFDDAYHALVPKADGFDERMRIYRLYHMLNHLNLHGAGFSSRGSTESPNGYFERAVKLVYDIVGLTMWSS